MDILCHMIGSSLIKSLQAITRTQFWGSSGSAYMAEFEAWNPALAPRRAARRGKNARFPRVFGRLSLLKGRFGPFFTGFSWCFAWF